MLKSGLISLVLLLICCGSSSIAAYKFLAVLHFPSRSHGIVDNALLKGLAAKGHQVDVYSAFELKNTPANFKHYNLPTLAPALQVATDDLLETVKRSVYENMVSFFDTAFRVTTATLEEPSVQNLLKSNESYDAVICEVFLGEAIYGIAEHFKAPLIGIGTFGAILWNNEMVGSPSPPSYVPSPMLKFTDHMTLGQRILNLAYLTFEKLYSDFVYLPKQEALYKKYFPHASKTMYEVRKNAALVLLNSHVSLGFARPYVPNHIEVGGMHINRKRTPLPADIQKFIDESKHGVIYFSMGSNLKSKNLPLEMRQQILKALGNLKQRVLWKFEDENLQGKPDNVHISNWFPQDDILAHDNVLAFITHGGLLSTTESIYHGKPLIGIPIFGDQFLNMARAVSNGYGIELNYFNINAENLQAAVEEIVGKASYMQKAKAMSERYRDQPMLPLERAVWWSEHIARHKGAEYLHCTGQELNFWQYHNIDAMLILYGGIMLVFVGILKLICMISCRLLRTLGLCGKNTTSKQAKKLKQK